MNREERNHGKDHAENPAPSLEPAPHAAKPVLYLAGTFLLAFAFVGANAAAKQCGTTFLQSNLLEAFLENAFTEFPYVASTHEDHDITRLEFDLFRFTAPKQVPTSPIIIFITNRML